MKKFVAVYALAILASCASFVHSAPPVSADSICFNQFAPTPVPVPGHPTLGICNNNILQVQVTGAPTSGPTAVPGPTDANGIPLVHPTAVGTISVNCASGCTGSTPIPFATNGSGQLIIVPATTVPVAIQTSVAIIPAQVNACNVGFTACSNVGTTVTDGYSDLLESIFSTGFVYNFNGSSWDRGRNAGIGNGVPSTGLGAHDSYGEFLTTLPTLTTGQYGSMQLDSSSRLIISPTGLPTPLATQPISGSVSVTGSVAVTGAFPTPVPVPTSASLLPKTVQCDPTTAANCALVSSSGVTDQAICSAAAVCANVQATAADGQTLGGVAGMQVLSNNFAFNGTTYDRLRTAGVGNTVAATGLLAGAHYCEFLTALPILTTATYGVAQCDSSGRQIMSPIGTGASKAAIAAASNGPTVIKASAGILSSYLITTAGTTTNETFWDNASACSGTIIAIVSNSGTQPTAVPGFYQKIDMVAANGITACGGTLSPGVTVQYY